MPNAKHTETDVASYRGGYASRPPMLYALDAKGSIVDWECWSDGDTLFHRWGQAGCKHQQSSSVCEPKNVGKANATTASEQAALEAIALWRKQVKKKYFQSEAEARASAGTTAVGTINPMLAQKYDEKKPPTGLIDAQPKLNGVRCLAYWRTARDMVALADAIEKASPKKNLNWLREWAADGLSHVVLQSRRGEPYNVQHIAVQAAQVLPVHTVFDGELYVHGMELQDIVSLVKRPQEGSAQLSYVVYDTTTDDGNDNLPWVKRRERLYAVLPPPFNLTVPSGIGSCQTHKADVSTIKQLHDHYVSNGYEGAILRTHDGVYRRGVRSPDLLKVKAFVDAEFKVVGWKRGVGAFENVPIFQCLTPDGRTFGAPPRGTMAKRRELLEQADSFIGRMYTVRYFALTNDGIPQFPVGIAFREECDL